MRSLFPNAWHVARREYLARVRTRSFVVVTAVLAVVGIGLSMLPLGIRLVQGDQAHRLAVHLEGDGLPATLPESVAGALNAATPPDGPRWVVSTASDAEPAREGVRSGDLDGLLTISRAPGGDLSYRLYTDEGATGGTPQAVQHAIYQVSVADRLDRAGVGQDAGQILAPAPMEVERTDPNAANGEENFGARYVFAMALVILTFMAIITYGAWVASSVAEEKSSRVMELLITAASPRQLLAGKVLGTGAAGLTQYVVVVIASVAGFLAERVLAARLVGAASAGQLEGVNLTVLAPFGIFFVAGFMLYAILYAALGSMANRQEEVQQVTGPMIFIGMIGYFSAFIGLNTPDATWIQVLSIVPFFSAYLLPARLLLSTVAPWEWLLAAVLMAAFLAGALWVAARIYSAGVLLYGQRPGLRAMFRAVRVDR
jgi:ABC-2 type transport system permease protein